MHDPLNGELGRLLALAPRDYGRINALVRQTCANTLSLPQLPAEITVDGPDDAAESAVVEFAEQFSVDVSSIGDDLRARFTSALETSVIGAVMLTFVADYLPRVRAGLEAIGLPVPWTDAVRWDHDSDPADVLFNSFLPCVARLRALDPVTSEIVRLRGARQHNCRLCQSLREGNALDAGGTESLYTQIDHFETSDELTERHKAALGYVDALIWSPAAIRPEVAAGVRTHFTEAQAFELNVDVMRNASDKIAVALATDAPRVENGTERYLIDADGQTVFS
ncbi:MAG: carboxymuconolactone decarboxylase family protein [Mycobacterium sp.]